MKVCKTFHDTETVVLRVCNDIILASRPGDDLTAAFYTVDHNNLISHFRYKVGIRVLLWSGLGPIWRIYTTFLVNLAGFESFPALMLGSPRAQF